LAWKSAFHISGLYDRHQKRLLWHSHRPTNHGLPGCNQRHVWPGPSTPVGNVYSINLTSGKANINKLAARSGLTQIRLRFKRDDNNNTVANILSLYSGNAALAADRPQLVITYTIP